MEKPSPIRRIVEKVVLEKPLLGMGPGMQMLLERSEEHGLHEGRGLALGKMLLFPKTYGMQVPHMGWNTISPVRHPLFADIPDWTAVYFVHSYCMETEPWFTIAETKYIFPCASAVANGNATGSSSIWKRVVRRG
ncbi:MAG: hypothetical protein LBU24_06270 [Methanocalculaceae archaeon]|jgi:glutamine amidotransferase|nr:hypothetical protein [Methanocalculaceae archaeon]